MDIQSILSQAIDKGIDADSMTKLVDLAERMADRLAAQEFAGALAAFQDACPEIPKESTAEITTRGGSRYSYKYARLDSIVHIVRPVLARHSLSFTWDSTTGERDISCACILRHVNGHKITASFSCPTETKSGMNSQQAVGAALTYAKRMALVQALGLTTTEPDTDGRDLSAETITESQQADLLALATEVGADLELFCKYMKVQAFDEIRTSEFSRAISALQAKGRKP